MAKEPEETQPEVSQKEPPKLNASEELLSAFLKKTIARDPGLTLMVEGQEEPVKIVGGEIRKVKVDTAWAMFTIDNCIIRTKTIQDRNNFLAWVAEGGTKPFGTSGQNALRVGPAGVHFTKVCGPLPQPAKAEAPEKGSTFWARGRHFGSANATQLQLG